MPFSVVIELLVVHSGLYPRDLNIYLSYVSFHTDYFLIHDLKLKAFLHGAIVDVNAFHFQSL